VRLIDFNLRQLKTRRGACKESDLVLPIYLDLSKSFDSICLYSLKGGHTYKSYISVS